MQNQIFIIVHLTLTTNTETYPSQKYSVAFIAHSGNDPPKNQFLLLVA